MQLYTAPEPVPFGLDPVPSVFLAGSIEQGTAIDWQHEVLDEISDLRVVVFNPRRKAWDASWVQSIDNPQFNKQVNWELDNLSRSDIAFFYFDPKTKSPITLMELGFMLGQSMQGGWYEIIVVCPDGFWRQGNVEIMCARAVVADGTRVSYVTELDAGISILRDDIERQLERAI